MGAKVSKRSSSSENFDYTIYVQTGDRPKAGTNACVYCILKGDGEKSQKTKLDVGFHDDFERGQLDKFLLEKQSVRLFTGLRLPYGLANHFRSI